ncbi:MAG: geranylgeranylglyceryl/heptaprenylglyceryl phosphate synthase [Candidatus Micrarchaeota archaeon]|nr:geranylgeranylglyceryl/heptaprenylglyceryl phosphate synthase [Candidatus Micrarchaeota archaeon]
MRTTLDLEDDVYKKLVNLSVEKYGNTKNMSQVMSDLLKSGGKRQKEEKLITSSDHPIKRGKIENYILDGIERYGGLLFAVIDPMDYKSLDDAVKTAKNANEGGADVILIGGSTGVQGEILDTVTRTIKESVNVPVVLFPGNIGTVTKYADAVYFMSLLNSNNPYWISKAQMLAAPTVKQMGIEALPTGYMVVEPGGTVGYVGEANLLPRDKPKLAAAMALGAQYMGFRFIITDAGSNPKEGHIPLEMVATVSKFIDVPYIVAGGVRTPEQAGSIITAGADAVQVGTAFEHDNAVEKVKQMVAAVRQGAKARKKE